jgi:hypothetical protein
MIEDFNEALWQKEHLSARRSERQMVNFRNTLAYCNLYDLGYKGTPRLTTIKSWVETM